MFKKVITLALAVSLALTAAACSARQETPAAPAAAAATANPRTPKDPYVDQIKIAYVAHEIGTPVNQAWFEGIKNEVAYYPNITVQGFDGKGSAEEQIKIMEELITQKYDAIIIQASDNKALSAPVVKAEQAGIVVVGLNLEVDAPHAAHVQMVDYDAGRLAAEAMARDHGEKGKFVIIQGLPGIPRPANLEKGFRETIAKFPNMEIIAAQEASFSKDKAIEVMNSMMQANPQIDGVFAINDAMAAGASVAAEAAGRLQGMSIWGADGEKDALKMIEDGKLTGTIYTNCWDEGATAARVACMIISSDYNTTTLTKTPLINMQPVVATKETVGTIDEKDRW